MRTWIIIGFVIMGLILLTTFPSSSEMLRFIELHEWEAFDEHPVFVRSGLSLVIEELETMHTLPEGTYDTRLLSEGVIQAIELLVKLGEVERAFQLVQLPLKLEGSPTFFEQLSSWGHFDLQLRILHALQEMEDSSVKAFYLTNMAIVLRDLEQLNESEAYFLQSIAYLKAQNKLQALGWQYQELAVMKMEVLQFAEAEELLFQAIQVFRKLDPPYYAGIAQSYNDLARPAVHAGKMEEAQGYFERAIELYEQHPQPDLRIKQAWVYHGYSNFLSEQGDYRHAETYGHKALELFEDDKKGAAWTYVRLSKLYFYAQQYEKSRTHALKATQLFEELEMHGGLLFAFQLLGKLELQAKQFDQAEHTFKRLSEVPASSPQHEVFKQYQFMDGMAQLALAQHQYEQAVLCLAQYDQLRLAQNKVFEEKAAREFEAHQALCRTHLGTERFAELWERSSKASVEDVVAMMEEKG